MRMLHKRSLTKILTAARPRHAQGCRCRWWGSRTCSGRDRWGRVGEDRSTCTCLGPTSSLASDTRPSPGDCCRHSDTRSGGTVDCLNTSLETLHTHTCKHQQLFLRKHYFFSTNNTAKLDLFTCRKGAPRPPPPHTLSPSHPASLTPRTWWPAASPSSPGRGDTGGDSDHRTRSTWTLTHGRERGAAGLEMSERLGLWCCEAHILALCSDSWVAGSYHLHMIHTGQILIRGGGSLLMLTSLWDSFFTCDSFFALILSTFFLLHHLMKLFLHAEHFANNVWLSQEDEWSHEDWDWDQIFRLSRLCVSSLHHYHHRIKHTERTLWH